MLVLVCGCARVPLGNAPLTIATTWPEEEQTRLEREFHRWGAPRIHSADGPVAIDWVAVAPGDDLARVLVPPLRPLDWRGRPVDLVLGGPTSIFAGLEEQGRLVAPWSVARRATIGWARNSRVERSGEALDHVRPLETLNARDTLIFDDPRHDPLALAWAQGVLRETTWTEGYALLVKAAAHSLRVPREPGASLAAVERGEAVLAPSLPFARRLARYASSGPGDVDMGGGCRHRHGGRQPLRQATALPGVPGGKRVRPRRVGPRDGSGPSQDLLADLLGATLVDAQNELVSGWFAWERAGRPSSSGQWLTEAPPWPPASVDKLLKTEGAGPLLDTLTEQLAPDAGDRAWLVRSWLAPERRVDGALLEEPQQRHRRPSDARAPLPGAYGCKGEWTAWARPARYRRVERQLALGSKA